jgi:hypothetical protein
MKSKKTNLNAIWEERSFPLPGTIEDFVQYFGVGSQEEMESMDFTEIEMLPRVNELELISCGGRYERGRETYYWTWDAPNPAKGNEEFIGSGKTYNEAAISGLVIYWELNTLRQKQSSS